MAIRQGLEGGDGDLAQVREALSRALQILEAMGLGGGEVETLSPRKAIVASDLEGKYRFTVDEAAFFLGFSRRTVYNRIQGKGGPRLRHHKDGDNTYILRTDAEAYAAACDRRCNGKR